VARVVDAAEVDVNMIDGLLGLGPKHKAAAHVVLEARGPEADQMSARIRIRRFLWDTPD
jgi:hypothetical protein